jgi:hypothetical protein
MHMNNRYTDAVGEVTHLIIEKNTRSMKLFMAVAAGMLIVGSCPLISISPFICLC